MVEVAHLLASSVGDSIPAASGGDLNAQQGAYRFVRNEEIDVQDIAEGGFAATAGLAAKHQLLIMPQDTTTLSYSHSVRSELGDLGGPKRSTDRGWLVHSSLLIDAKSANTVGLIDQHRWVRNPRLRGSRHKRKDRPYKDKESFKWQSSMERVSRRLDDVMSRVITVADREADVYEFLSESVDRGWRFVVRVCWDRTLEDKDHIRQYMASRDVIGHSEVEVEQKGGRRARTARLEIRSARVKVNVPRRPAGSGLEPVELGCVYAVEVDVPEGAEGLCWMLWTTEEVEGIEAALEVIRYYRMRWRVEDFHKAWKSGCRVEELRMQEADSLERMAVILAFIAVRVLQIREWGKDEDRPCDEVLDDDEWRVLWASTQKRKAMPKEAPTLKWAYYAVAKLGGWFDSKRTGRVGMKALWRGLFILDQRVEGWRVAKRMQARAKM